MRTIVELHPQWNVHGKIREAGDIAMVHLKNWDDQYVKFIGLLGEQNAEILPYFSNCTLLGWGYNLYYIEGNYATRTSVTVMSTDICNNFYKEFQHFDSKICVQTVKPKVHIFYELLKEFVDDFIAEVSTTSIMDHQLSSQMFIKNCLIVVPSQ